MRAILFSLAILLLSGPMPAQQSKRPIPVQRTFVPDEPLVCTAFDAMAARLDAVYKTEEISKSEDDEGVKKYRDGAQEEGVGYFIVGKDKHQRICQQRDKLADLIRSYVVQSRRRRLETVHTQC